MSDFDEVSEPPEIPEAPELTLTRRPRPRARAFRFSLGEALARTFGFYGRHLPAMALLSFVAYAPITLWQLSAAERVFSGGPAGTIRVIRGLGVVRLTFWDLVSSEVGYGGQILSLVMVLLLQSVVALAVFQHLGGGRIQYGRSIGQGLGRLLPVLGVALLIAIIFVALGFVGALLLAAFLGGSVGAAILFLLITAVVVATIFCIYFLSVPATVVERIGPAKAMARSASLTSGARWKIFAVLLVILALATAIGLIVKSSMGEFPDSLGQAQVGVVVWSCANALLSLFAAVAAAVVYYDLRKAKEGVGIDELMRVFE